MRQLFAARWDRIGNLPNLPAIFPDMMAPVVRATSEGRELTMMRWGFPPPPNVGPRPVTNVRNVKSPYWRAWLRPGHRCLVAGDQLLRIYRQTAENPALVRARRGPAAVRLRRHLARLDRRAKERSGRAFAVFVSHMRAQRPRQAGSRQGDAGHSDDARRVRDLAFGARRGGSRAATAAAERGLEGGRDWPAGGWRGGRPLRPGRASPRSVASPFDRGWPRPLNNPPPASRAAADRRRPSARRPAARDRVGRAHRLARARPCGPSPRAGGWCRARGRARCAIRRDSHWSWTRGAFFGLGDVEAVVDDVEDDLQHRRDDARSAGAAGDEFEFAVLEHHRRAHRRQRALVRRRRIGVAADQADRRWPRPAWRRNRRVRC